MNADTVAIYTQLLLPKLNLSYLPDTVLIGMIFAHLYVNSPRQMYTDQSYKELEYSDLIDLLAEQTAKYTQALVKGDSGNTLDYYRNLITTISKEIETRQAANSLNGDKQAS